MIAVDQLDKWLFLEARLGDNNNKDGGAVERGAEQGRKEKPEEHIRSQNKVPDADQQGLSPPGLKGDQHCSQQVAIFLYRKHIKKVRSEGTSAYMQSTKQPSS